MLFPGADMAVLPLESDLVTSVPLSLLLLLMKNLPMGVECKLVEGSLDTLSRVVGPPAG